MELIVNVLTDYDQLVEERISSKAIERCNVRFSTLGISIQQRHHVTCKEVRRSYEFDDILERCQRDDLMPKQGLVIFFSSIRCVVRREYLNLPNLKQEYYDLGGEYRQNCAIIFDALKNAEKSDAGGNRLIDTIILHEIGHHFGLGHDKTVPSIMYPFADQSKGEWSETEREHIIKKLPYLQITRLIANMANTVE